MSNKSKSKSFTIQFGPIECSILHSVPHLFIWTLLTQLDYFLLHARGNTAQKLKCFLKKSWKRIHLLMGVWVGSDFELLFWILHASMAPRHLVYSMRWCSKWIAFCCFSSNAHNASHFHHRIILNKQFWSVWFTKFIIEPLIIHLILLFNRFHYHYYWIKVMHIAQNASDFKITRIYYSRCSNEWKWFKLKTIKNKRAEHKWRMEEK